MNLQNSAAKQTSSRRMSGNTESIHRCAFECIMIMILMRFSTVIYSVNLVRYKLEHTEPKLITSNTSFTTNLMKI